MMPIETMVLIENDDAELVAHCLRGSREAFGQIVARYQNLICSLAYSATGSLTQSEDLAQETFVTAWRQLAELREPAKLRSWLCGIVRNLSCRVQRDQTREPLHGAESLETAAELPAPEAHPLAQTISREEEAILWRSLAQIPVTYREPLILFYRESESIEKVAQVLDLTEEAVRQRLVRGRKLLHERVLSFVEGTLSRTSPGQTFTLAVLATLPMTGTTAKAATTGATLIKTGAVAKGVLTLGTLGGALGMFGSMFVAMRAQADDAQSPRERQFLLQMIRIRLVLMFCSVMAFSLLQKMDFVHGRLEHQILISGFLFTGCAVGMTLLIYSTRRQRRIQIEDKTYVSANWLQPRKQTDAAAPATGAKAPARFRAVRFMAFGLVMAAVMIFQGPWQEHLGKALQITAVWLFALWLGYRSWQNRPRYYSLRSNWVALWPVIWGLLTLVFFNVCQYSAQTGVDPSAIASTATVILFNVAVVVAYGTFAAVLFWQRRKEFTL